MEGCGAGSGARRALHPGEERSAALFVAGLRGCGAAGPLCASARPLPPLSALPPRSLPALRGLGCGGGAGNARPDAAEAQWEGEGRERALVGRRWEGGCSSRAGGCGGREAAVRAQRGVRGGSDLGGTHPDAEGPPRCRLPALTPGSPLRACLHSSRNARCSPSSIPSVRPAGGEAVAQKAEPFSPPQNQAGPDAPAAAPRACTHCREPRRCTR